MVKRYLEILIFTVFFISLFFSQVLAQDVPDGVEIIDENSFYIKSMAPAEGVINIHPEQQIFISFNKEISSKITEKNLDKYIFIISKKRGCVLKGKFFKQDKNIIIINGYWGYDDNIVVQISQNICNTDNQKLDKDYFIRFSTKCDTRPKDPIREARKLKKEHEHLKDGNKQQKRMYKALEYLEKWQEGEKKYEEAINNAKFSIHIKTANYSVNPKQFDKIKDCQEFYGKLGSKKSRIYIYLKIINSFKKFKTPYKVYTIVWYESYGEKFVDYENVCSGQMLDYYIQNNFNFSPPNYRDRFKIEIKINEETVAVKYIFLQPK